MWTIEGQGDKMGQSCVNRVAARSGTTGLKAPVSVMPATVVSASVCV